MIKKTELTKLYTTEGKSMSAIASILGCSVNKVVYWMDKHKIDRRSISDAVYLHNHPDGDPFEIKNPKSNDDYWLLGMGLGLYWGEGTKANLHSVRLGNTDPELIKVFIKFLVQMCGVDFADLRFGIQIFSDCSISQSEDFWEKYLNANSSQFYKTIKTPSRSKGTYRKKNKLGVLTIYYNNSRLRDILVEMLPRK